ncbi:MDR family MFS transporter [Specibacter sp. NPDC057265]|uniref:MDR family MFS transporter n=1 Tax=Specibacter sp. NPDC057265 TaxID=3346075 RepID=UPI0036398A36
MSQTQTIEAPADAGEKRKIVLLFVGLMVTMLLASLNQTVLSSALPTLVGELNGVEHMAWVITAFILASTIMMPVYGKLGDLLGRKPMLLFAITIFTVGSVIGALAPDMTTLIIARVVQGLGGGGLMILSQATIADVIPARERGKYMGIMGGVFAFSSVAGPLIGGGLTEGPGWRWAFWMNVPLAVLAILATIFLLHVPKVVHAVRPRIDYPGMILIAIATTALVLVGTWGGAEFAWMSPQILGLAAVAVVTAVLFVMVERRAAEPVMPMTLFKSRNFNLTTLAGLLTGIAMFGAIGYMPTYMQMATGYSATEAGLLMIPMMACMLLVSVIVGRRVSATGRYKVSPIAGSVILALALALMATLKADTPVYMICVYLGIMGVGLGASMQILTLVAQNSFPLKFVGTATAGQNYFRQVGATLGTAVIGSLFATRLHSLVAEKIPSGTTGGDGANSFTPALVNSLPEPVKALIIQSYNESLIPLFLWMVPLAVLAAVILCFVKEVPLATKIERDPAVDVSASAMAGFEGDVAAVSASATATGPAAAAAEDGPAAPRR